MQQLCWRNAVVHRDESRGAPSFIESDWTSMVGALVLDTMDTVEQLTRLFLTYVRRRS